MTPEQLQLLNDLNEKVAKLIDIYYRTHFIDKDVFSNPVYFNGAVYFKLPNFLKDTVLPTGSTTGAKIGITGDKVAFLGASPIAQQAAIASPTAPSAAYVQAEAASAKTAIDAIRAALQAFGLIS